MRYVRLDDTEFIADSTGAPFHWGDKPAILVASSTTWPRCIGQRRRCGKARGCTAPPRRGGFGRAG